jgi:hypothetical protein
MSTELLTDYIEDRALAVELKKHPRTIRRWMEDADGLPHVRLGRRFFIHIPTAREWLLKRMKYPNPTRD